MYNDKSGVMKDMNYVIYGEEKLLMEQRLTKLKKQYQIQEENMNFITYWCHETPMSAIIEDAITPPFLTEYKMIVIKNPLFLTTQKQKDVNEDDIKLFLDYLSQDNPSTILVVYHDVKNFDERKKVVKTLRKLAHVYEIGKLNHGQLYKTAYQAVKSRGCQIDTEALELLLSRVPNDLMILSQEINKICLYSQYITVEVVNKLVAKQLEENVFELTKAILNKETKRSFQIYRDLKINNEEPIKLIILVANSMRLLYQVKLLDRKGYNDHEIAKILSLNPYRLKYIRQDGKDYELKELLTKLDELSQLDIAIKTGKIDRFRGLELFLTRMGGQ